ncbi:MAG: N,N-dimethylformamidase [Proteobacteria bacterium]|nr:N,N-dimethylformamidase [Pseudomonadota bacterium]MBI3497863.1 N,N-dimethylformamidase [Pseudomonadota bacterium]
MTRLLGYADKNARAPGEPLAVMVSCVGAERYQADLVRLLSPNAGPTAPPFREAVVPSPINGEHRGRRQDMHGGSWAVIRAHRRLAAIRSFTIQAMVWPTTPEKGPQAILGTWSETAQSGYGLGLDETGQLELTLGDGTGTFRLKSGQKLFRRKWYLVAASFEAETGEAVLYQEPLADKGFAPGAPIRVAAKSKIRPSTGAGSFLFAAWLKGEADAPTSWEKMLVGGHFNGKIDRPRLASIALDRAGIVALAGNVIPAGLGEAVVALWDFSRDIHGIAIHDISANRLSGETVNLPARAMTGFNWDGSEMNWRNAPEQYGAIHFHDDDLYDARWQPDFTLDLPQDLKSGVYAIRLTQDEAYFHIPFFVTSKRDHAKAKIAYLASTATYTVYANNRGRFSAPLTELYQGRLTVFDEVDMLQYEFPDMGLSTYDRHSDGSGVCYSSRLRPITNIKPGGRMWNFGCDLFLVDWLERTGLGYDVITDDDLHREGIDLLKPYAVVVTGSHPEYDSLEMLEALDGYLRQGGRFMYMGGNGFYWRIAYHPSLPGVIEVRRSEDGTRAWDAEVGEYYHSFTGEYGGLWRRQLRAPNLLAGVGFISQGFDACSYYRLTEAATDSRVSFAFAGVEGPIVGNHGVLQGGAAGLEIDSYDPLLGSPPHALVVARSENHSNTYELVNEEVRVAHGMTDGIISPLIHADMVFFETPNGGAVFSTGSIAFAGSLGTNGFKNDVAILSTNVLKRFIDPTPFKMPTL